MGFAEQIAKFAAETKDKADAVVRETVEEVGQRLIDRSPVLTSAFRSNWNYSLEAPDRFFNKEKTGVTVVNGIEDLPRAAGGFIHYVTNSAPYGPALERGHSKQAPQGVVGLTSLEFDSIVAASVLKVQR